MDRIENCSIVFMLAGHHSRLWPVYELCLLIATLSTRGLAALLIRLEYLPLESLNRSDRADANDGIFVNLMERDNILKRE